MAKFAYARPARKSQLQRVLSMRPSGLFVCRSREAAAWWLIRPDIGSQNGDYPRQKQEFQCAARPWRLAGLFSPLTPDSLAENAVENPHAHCPIMGPVMVPVSAIWHPPHRTAWRASLVFRLRGQHARQRLPRVARYVPRGVASRSSARLPAAFQPPRVAEGQSRPGQPACPSAGRGLGRIVCDLAPRSPPSGRLGGGSLVALSPVVA